MEEYFCISYVIGLMVGLKGLSAILSRIANNLSGEETVLA